MMIYNSIKLSKEMREILLETIEKKEEISLGNAPLKEASKGLLLIHASLGFEQIDVEEIAELARKRVNKEVRNQSSYELFLYEKLINLFEISFLFGSIEIKKGDGSGSGSGLGSGYG